MDNLTLQIKAVCLVSILAGVMGCIIPDCRLKKAFNSFCAVVIVFAIIMPFSSLGKNADKTEFFDFSEVKGDVSLQSETAEKLIYAKVVEGALCDRFSEMGLTATVTVECEKADESYKIISFTVTAGTDEEKEKAAAYLNEGFNGIPVYYKEE